MRKLIVIAAAIAAMAVPSGALANAAPANQTAGSGFAGITGWYGTTQGGQHMTTTQFRASYYDPFAGPVTCAGVNQMGKNIPSSWGRDSYTCTSTIGDLTTLGWTPFVGYTSSLARAQGAERPSRCATSLTSSRCQGSPASAGASR